MAGLYRWSDGYALVGSVFDMSKENPGDTWMFDPTVPLTTTHMSLTESYPSTFDAIQGNYS